MTADTPQRAPVFETRLRVRSYELDAFGHVNHAVFFNYFEYARWEVLRAGGFDAAELSRRGWSVVLAHAEADFRRPALQDDELLVRTRVVAARRTALRIHHRVVRERREEGGGSEPVAEGEVVAVWLDADGRPMPLPAEVSRAFGVAGTDR